MVLTEKHVIKRSSKTRDLYNRVDSYCTATKNLYNKANEVVEQANKIGFKLKKGTELTEEESSFLRAINKSIGKYNMRSSYPIDEVSATRNRLNNKYFLNWYLRGTDEYKAIVYSGWAFRCIGVLCDNWKTYFMNTRNKKAHPRAYKEDARFKLIFTSKDFTILDDGMVVFPDMLNDVYITARNSNITEISFLTNQLGINIKCSYQVDDVPVREYNGRALGIDLGVNNLATVVSNTEMEPVIMNGRPLKSINQYYNKKSAELHSQIKLINDMSETKKTRKLTQKRNDKVNDYMHKVSKKVIELAKENDITLIIIGNNKGWKDNVDMGKKNNQNFVSIPYYSFMSMLKYKGALEGIDVKTVDEHYTSGTSYLDGEMPSKENYNYKRRISRGQFQSNQGIVINADVNAAYQIMKKAGITLPIKEREKVVRIYID